MWCESSIKDFRLIVYMRFIKFIVYLLWGVVFISLPVYAGERYAFADYENPLDSALVENFTIRYRLDHTDIDTLYLDNAAQIEHIRCYLKNSPRIDSITIHSWASPEGSYSHNLSISRFRAESAKRFLLAEVSDPARLSEDMIRINPLAENWPGLLLAVTEGYTRHDRDKVLKILHAKDIGDETRKWRLMQLDGGYTWDYLVRKFMPELRSATWVCVWMKTDIPSLDRLASIEALPIDAPVETVLDVPSISELKGSKKEPFYLRTNLLAPLSNFGFEYCINDRWSVEADYYFPWITRNPDNRNCFQILGWNLGGRYWFGSNRSYEDRLEGHSVGLSVSAGYYDFEKDYSGKQGEFAHAGVDYLYSLPVCRDRLHLEFSIGVGYIYSYIKPYDVFEDGGKAFKKGYAENFHWVGPTKAAISLVVPIKAGRRAGR